MTSFSRFIDTLIDSIIKFSDYFLIEKHVTLSEGTLIAVSFGRAVWFSIFGVQMIDGIISHGGWTFVFIGITLVHFLTFFADNLWYRIMANALQALLWCTLAILASMTYFSSPTVPTFVVFSLTAVFIAVRLMRDRRTQYVP